MIERHPSAKINLALAVLGKRSDSFHDIRSWVAKLDWADRLTLSPSSGLSLTVDSQDPAVPAGPNNLVWRAAERLAKAANRSPDVAIHLQKSLPSGAGLGGGSSDAAETLLGLNDLWQLNWPRDQLAEVGAELGSDVPLFMMDGPVLIAGRGEVLAPLPLAWHGWAAVIVPSFGLSTASVYRAWSIREGSRRDLDMAALEAARTDRELLSLLFNDLEAPAFSIEPRLRELHARMDNIEGRHVRMTGSGSALFTLFNNQADAESWRMSAAGRVPSGTSFHIVRVL